MIRSQAEAFGRDDATAAYSYAAPAIKGIFPQAEYFMSMVEHSYPPVYRHKSFEFGEARVEDGMIAQRVHIIDANGEAWEALYTLEQQTDGSLKITGCRSRPGGVASHASASRCRARINSDTTMVTLTAFHASPFMNAAA